MTKLSCYAAASILALTCTINPALAATMVNKDVIELVKAGLSEETILQSIDAADPAKFDTSATGLIALKKGGATDRIVQKVLSRQLAKGAPAGGENASAPNTNPTSGGACRFEAPEFAESVGLRADGKIIGLTYQPATPQTDASVLKAMASSLTLGLVRSTATTSLRISGAKATVRLKDRSPEILDVVAPPGANVELVT